jgi:hypothetical protein
MKAKRQLAVLDMLAESGWVRHEGRFYASPPSRLCAYVGSVVDVSVKDNGWC